MGDMKEVFDAMKDDRAARKEQYRREVLPADLKLLAQLPVRVENRRDGAGGVVSTITFKNQKGTPVVDFWHSTGRWSLRGKSTGGRGIQHMAKYFNLEPGPRWVE